MTNINSKPAVSSSGSLDAKFHGLLNIDGKKLSLLGCKTDYDLMFGPYFVPRLHPPTLVERICLVWNSWQSLLMLKRGFRLILHNVFG